MEGEIEAPFAIVRPAVLFYSATTAQPNSRERPLSINKSDSVRLHVRSMVWRMVGRAKRSLGPVLSQALSMPCYASTYCGIDNDVQDLHLEVFCQCVTYFPFPFPLFVSRSLVFQLPQYYSTTPYLMWLITCMHKC
jgi:hypothetical protein